MEKIRLQKYFTDCGIMSRRACEKEISAGNIRINGVTATLGDKVDPNSDSVTLNGEPVIYRRTGFTYIMLNKPLGYVTTMSDEKGRKTAADLVRDAGVRVYPVGRLDMYSEGLLLFTDDGELANKLSHPSDGFSKIYSVMVCGHLDDDRIKSLSSPMELDGYTLRPVKVKKHSEGINRQGQEYTLLIFTLYEGRNRQIRRMCEKCGIKVMSLRRISEGGISLGSLPVGKWRRLYADEIEILKKS